jgi:hypothetical protein
MSKIPRKELLRLQKPCWIIGYCPYGPLVEDFPCPVIERGEMLEHHALLIKNLAENKVTKENREVVEVMIKSFKATDYPEKIPESQRRLEAKLSCAVFGHMCPVYFVSEGFSEEAWIVARNSVAKKSAKVARLECVKN